MFKFVKIETAVATEAALNKLQDDGWRIAGCGPDYLVLTNAPRVSRRTKQDPDEGSDDIRVSLHTYRTTMRENYDLTLQVRDLRQLLRSYQDEDSVKHWDALRQSRDRYKAVADELFHALCWASGASDFAPADSGVPAGEGRKGWERGPRLALAAYSQALELDRKENREL